MQASSGSSKEYTPSESITIGIHKIPLLPASLCRLVQVSVDENPYLWWQHAGQAVLSERSLTLGPENSRLGLTHRRYYRQLYRLYYLRHRSLLYWLLDLLTGCPNFSRDALVQLEAQLGDSEIAQFRWWVWASQWASQRQHGNVRLSMFGLHCSTGLSAS